MRTSGAPSLARAARSPLAPLLAALLGSGGCTLLVGAQLSDKPDEAAGPGGGGQGGADVTGTTAAVTTGPSAVSTGPGTTDAASVSASASSSTGMPTMCSPDLADCDLKPQNGCEINIKTDAKNCGACGYKCLDGKKCDEKVCK